MKLSEKITYLFISSILLIAILPKAVQMAIICSYLAILIISSRKIKLSKTVLPLFAIGLIHAISIFFNSFGESSIDNERIVAAINTCSLWIIGPLIYSYVKELPLDKNKILKSVKINMLIMALLSLLFIVLNHIGYNFGNSPILAKLVTVDWLNGQKSYRFTGLMEYPNVIPIYCLVTLPFILSAEKSIKTQDFLYSSIAIAATILSHSRIGSVLVTLNVILIFYQKYFKTKSRPFAKFILVASVCALVALSFSGISSSITNLLDSREGSNAMRTQIYSTSISETTSQSPIIGLGIKTMFNGYPLGSHSTYIGTYYKTGIIGSFLLLAGLLTLYLQLKYRPNKIAFYSYLLLLVMLLLEDLDGSDWLCIYFFIIFGISDYHLSTNIAEDDATRKFEKNDFQKNITLRRRNAQYV